MTVIQPNSITGVSSITALSGTLEIFNSSGTSIGNFTSGVSTVTNLSASNIDVSGIVTATSFSGNVTGNVTVGTGATVGGDTNTVTVSTNGSERLRVTSTGLVGIGTTNPNVSLDLGSKTDAIELPQGTTAQRPSGNNPYLRWNTTNSALEFYNGTDWVEIISDYFPSGSTILG